MEQGAATSDDALNVHDWFEEVCRHWVYADKVEQTATVIRDAADAGYTLLGQAEGYLDSAKSKITDSQTSIDDALSEISQASSKAGDIINAGNDIVNNKIPEARAYLDSASENVTTASEKISLAQAHLDSAIHYLNNIEYLATGNTTVPHDEGLVSIPEKLSEAEVTAGSIKSSMEKVAKIGGKMALLGTIFYVGGFPAILFYRIGKAIYLKRKYSKVPSYLPEEIALATSRLNLQLE